MHATKSICSGEAHPPAATNISPAQPDSPVLNIEDIANRALTPYSEHQVAIRAMSCSNVFSSHDEKSRIFRMASLAALMYQEMDRLSEVDALFPHALTALPTPGELGMTLPKGLKVQAFRHHDEVIFAIRGTELTKDKTTLLKNLIADAGIGRHKTSKDLIDSLKSILEKTSSLYEYEIDEQTLKMAVDLINSRITGHDDSSRGLNIAGRTGSAMGKGAAVGGAGGIFLGTMGGFGLFAVGLASGGIVIVIGAAVTAGVATIGAGVNGTIEALKCVTAADGYPTLQAYIKTIDAYLMKLKEKHISDADTVITVGHSLAGYLAGVIGAMHGDEIFSFNGPGVDFAVEMPHLIANLGLDRTVQKAVTYHSISMEADFIGNLAKRTGGLRKLYVPIPLRENHGDFPACLYTSPLSHHGIGLMAQVLKNSTVSSFSPHSLSSYQDEYRLALVRYVEEPGPRIEEIKEEKSPVAASVPTSTPTSFFGKAYNFAAKFFRRPNK